MTLNRADDHLEWWRDPSPYVGHIAWTRFFAVRAGCRKGGVRLLALTALLLLGLTHATAHETNISSIEGTWKLAFADVLHPDGTRESDYGSKPKGVMHVDSAGRYAIFIFDGSRPHFASGDKKTGTDWEIKAALLGTSSHYGKVTVDTAAHTLDFHIEGSTYPNWEGTTQRRRFETDGTTLSYRVPPRPNGDVPVTGWKRLPSPRENP